MKRHFSVELFSGYFFGACGLFEAARGDFTSVARAAGNMDNFYRLPQAIYKKSAGASAKSRGRVRKLLFFDLHLNVKKPVAAGKLPRAFIAFLEFKNRIKFILRR